MVETRLNGGVGQPNQSLLKRRDKKEICRDVIKVMLSGPVRKTRVVYGSNLNFKQAGIFLEALIKHGFVKQVEKNFEATPKGKAFYDLMVNLPGF
jgi:predicted transcriptional regulator